MIIDLKNCTVRLKDASGMYLDVELIEGTFSYTEKRPMRYIKSLTKLKDVLPADEEPVDVKLEFSWSSIKGATIIDPTTPAQYPYRGYYEVLGDIYWESAIPGTDVFLLKKDKLYYNGQGSFVGSDKSKLMSIDSSGDVNIPYLNVGIGSVAAGLTEWPVTIPTLLSSFDGSLVAPEGLIVWVDPRTKPTIEDALKQLGSAANWISTSDDPCVPYCVDIEIENDPACSGVEKEMILVSQFRHEEINHDLRGTVITVSGKANVVGAVPSRT